jgi:uncharacterized protein involved in exopolysaccharide biosynthesis
MSTASASRLTPPELRSAVYPRYTLRDLLTATFYHRRAMMVAFAIPLLIGLAAALFARPIYTAQARLLVLYGSDYVFHPGNSVGGSDIALDRNQIMQGEQQILSSNTLAIDTLKAVGVGRVYPGTNPDNPESLGLAVTRFGTDLTITMVPLSNAVELSFRSLDRQVAADVLKELIAQYLTRRNVVFDKNGPAAGNGASSEREQFADRLHTAEAALAQYGAEHGISNLDEQVTTLLRQKADTITEQNQTDQAIRETAARLASLRKQLADIPQSVQMFAESTRSQQTTGLTEALLKLETTRRDLLSRYQDDFPLVVDVNTQIAKVRAQLAATASRDGAVARQGRNTVYDEIHGQEITQAAQLQGLQARRAELASTADSLAKRLEDLNGYGRAYRDLQRSRDVLDESYRAIARSNEEAQLAGALERARGANVRVVQPPELPSAGRSGRAALLAGGLALGVLAALAALAIRNGFRQTMITVREVERAMVLPVLAAVPAGGTRAAAPSAARTRRTAADPRLNVANITPHGSGQASFGT